MELINRLQEEGFEVWVYTSSFRSVRYIRRLFQSYGLHFDEIVNGQSGVNGDTTNQENGGVSSGVTEDHEVSLLTPESISENLLYFISGIINIQPGLRAWPYSGCRWQTVLPAPGRRILLINSIPNSKRLYFHSACGIARVYWTYRYSTGGIFLLSSKRCFANEK